MIESSPPPEFDPGPASHGGTRSGDVRFVNAMTAAGLLTELEPEELERILVGQTSDDAPTRYLDILRRYYEANGDANAGVRRRMTDRFFMHQKDDPVTAKQLVVRISLLTTELGKLTLDRIGDEREGTYVLRAGDHIGGIVDEEEHDGGQDAQGTLTVRALVRAVNVLLERNRIRHRFVPLLVDGNREAYVATTVTGALNLCQADYLEEVDVESLIDFASW
ncbi:MAG: hypothetical protein KC416_01815 [Myxococcales bacterium]|nr:hypothetical protein [Myxococcales bacterium]